VRTYNDGAEELLKDIPEKTKFPRKRPSRMFTIAVYEVGMMRVEHLVIRPLG
jgi:hypothetical protein